MRGGAAVNSSPPPAASVTDCRPRASADMRRPGAASPNRRRRSRGSRAASGVLTTSTCEAPLAVTRTRRSTSGPSTPRYSAESPWSSGAGSVPGQVSAMVLPALVIASIAPSPPPDSRTPTGVATGRPEPSSASTRVVSTGTQAPSFRVRTGNRCSVATKPPSGWAYTSRDSPRSPSTSTGRPLRTASAAASVSVTCGPGAGAARPAGPASALDGTVGKDSASTLASAALQRLLTGAPRLQPWWEA